MRPVTAVAILNLFLSLPVSVHGSGETTFTATSGDTVTLPCYNPGNVTPSETRWTKNGLELSGGGQAAAGSPGRGASARQQRLTVRLDGSLLIREVAPADEGSYLCNSSLPNRGSFQAVSRLQVVSGPNNVSMSISPGTKLPNGSVVVRKGASVFFECSSSSYPSQRISLSFKGLSMSNDTIVSTTGNWLEYRVDNIQPKNQGIYSCKAQNTLSNRTASGSTELIVSYAPERHPECQWASGNDSSHVQFICSWFGGQPHPTLSWSGSHTSKGSGTKDIVYASAATDRLSVMLNRSKLFDGLTLTCMGRHPALEFEKPKTCSFSLKPPYPEGEPLITALESSSVTLKCTESTSIPPANTGWKIGLNQEDIVSGSKYILSEQGPTYSLTIVNVTKDDEGTYFCRSENPLGVRELEVYLTVKTSSPYMGAIIGVFLALLIVGSAFVIARTIYSSRHKICLGSGFGRTQEDGGDVLSLVDSDDEPTFQDAVPRLPPLTNGHQTTLVQIHHIPSSDQEDTVVADAALQQQGGTENREKEEPVELVTL